MQKLWSGGLDFVVGGYRPGSTVAFLYKAGKEIPIHPALLEGPFNSQVQWRQNGLKVCPHGKSVSSSSSSLSGN